MSSLTKKKTLHSINNKTKKNLWKAFDKEFARTSNDDVTSITYADTENKSIMNEPFLDEDDVLCPECDELMNINNGHHICAQCGFTTPVIDFSPEWTSYDDSASAGTSRCGMPINPLMRESSSVCGLLRTTNAHTYRINKYMSHQLPQHEKSQYKQFMKLAQYCSNHGIPKKIVDDAMFYYKHMCEHTQMYRGDNREGILIGALDLACKINKYPRTPNELADVFNKPLSVVTKGCRIAHTIISDLDQMDTHAIRDIQPHDFIERFCSRIGMNEEFTKLCKFIVIKFEKMHNWFENTPNAVAAGVIYFVITTFSLDIPKQILREEINISEVTINKCTRQIEKYKSELIPTVIAKKHGIDISAP